MTLWSAVKVNSHPVGLIDVQRLAPQGLPDDGEMCRYRWVVLVNDTDTRLVGEIDFPYGSWVALYAVVLAAADEQSAQAIDRRAGDGSMRRVDRG